MSNAITIENIIEQINNIDLSIKDLKKKVKNEKYKKTKHEYNKDIKRPLNSYMIYYTENYKNYKKDNPDLISKEIAKLCGENLRNIKSNEKSKIQSDKIN